MLRWALWVAGWAIGPAVFQRVLTFLIHQTAVTGCICALLILVVFLKQKTMIFLIRNASFIPPQCYALLLLNLQQTNHMYSLHRHHTG